MEKQKVDTFIMTHKKVLSSRKNDLFKRKIGKCTRRKIQLHFHLGIEGHYDDAFDFSFFGIVRCGSILYG